MCEKEVLLSKFIQNSSSKIILGSSYLENKGEYRTSPKTGKFGMSDSSLPFNRSSVVWSNGSIFNSTEYLVQHWFDWLNKRFQLTCNSQYNSSLPMGKTIENHHYVSNIDLTYESTNRNSFTYRNHNMISMGESIYLTHWSDHYLNIVQ